MNTSKIFSLLSLLSGCSGCTFSHLDRQGVVAWATQTAARKVNNEEARSQAMLAYQRVRDHAAELLPHNATLVGEHVRMTFEAWVANGQVEVWESFSEERDIRFDGQSRRIGAVNDSRFPDRKKPDYVLFAIRPTGLANAPGLAKVFHRGDARVLRSGESMEVLEVDATGAAELSTIFSTTPPWKMRPGMTGSLYDFVSEFRSGGGKRVYEIRVGRAFAAGEPRVTIEVDGKVEMVGCAVEVEESEDEVPITDDGWWKCEATTTSAGFVVLRIELPYPGAGRLP